MATNIPHDYAKVKERVEKILKVNPECRANDNLLILTYWAEHDDPLFKAVIYNLGQEKAKFGLTAPESITRAKRKLHEEGKFEYTVGELARRKGKQEEVRKYFRNQQTTLEP